MIDRKKIKKEAHNNLKATYFTSIIVVFFISLIMNEGYNYSSNMNGNDKNGNYAVVSQVVEKERIKQGKSVDENERGVLAPIVNKITADKSSIISFINGFKLIYYDHNISAGMLSLAAATVMFLVYVFVKLVLDIGKIRYFLESRRYRKTKFDKVLFPYRSRKTIHLSLIIFFKNLYQFFWDLTIIGGIIKHYEYMMIPYVLAENPNITKKEAFNISKEMTNGLKWEIFKLDFSLIGWYILSIITFGLSELFYFGAYKEFIFSELYINVRNSKKNSLSFGKLLNDEYLNVDETNDEYPIDKYNVSLWQRKDFKSDYNQSYSIQKYIMFFFTFAFVGWLWEVILCLVTEGVFANRGTMHGPWLPIYGFGVLFILIILKKFRSKPILYFLLSVVLAGILEYSTAWYLETFKHMKWWDYSGYFLNLHGRICLEGLLVFGFGASAVTYFLCPLLSNYYGMIKNKVVNIICIILVLLFSFDIFYSMKNPNVGKGITSYKNDYIKIN